MGTERSQAYKNYTQKCPIKNVQSLSPGFLAIKIQQEPRELTKLPKKPTRWYLKMSSVYHQKMQRNLLDTNYSRDEKRNEQWSLCNTTYRTMYRMLIYTACINVCINVYVETYIKITSFLYLFATMNSWLR